jgi:hypothetical protein
MEVDDVDDDDDQQVDWLCLMNKKRQKRQRVLLVCFKPITNASKEVGARETF